MSETRKNHLAIDGGQVKEDDHVASYKPIPETVGLTFIETDTGYIQENVIMDSTEDPDDHWDQDSTANMLTLYLQNIEKFRNPNIRKKNVWIDIANGLGNKSPDSCDKKFRNLKQTYIRLLRKRKINGVTAFKWPYFDIFEEIYNVDGEYQPEIQQKISDGTSEFIAKELLDVASTNGQNEEVRRKVFKKRNTEFRKVAVEMRDRQRIVEEKLDRLINIVEESNNIQKERNRLFQQFLDNLNRNR